MLPNDTLTGRQLDRALAEALGWRAEVISFPWQSPRWAIVDSNHSPIDNDAKAVALTAEAAWEFCPPFSADTPEGREAMWGVVKYVVQWQTEQGERSRWEFSGPTDGKWTARLVSAWDRTDGLEIGEASAPTLPAAVAHTALAALSAKEAPDGN